MSGIERKPVYTPADVAGHDYASQLGAPGTYPFTRGRYATRTPGPPIHTSAAGSTSRTTSALCLASAARTASTVTRPSVSRQTPCE